MSDAAQVQSRLSAALSEQYRIERELGRGGMATVYLAHDLKHDRPVAIKVLHEDLGATLGPERFLAEIRTTARFQHSHILPLLDSGAVGGVLYYVMPFVEGETLRDRLARDIQLPIEDAIRFALEVADALGYSHAHGVVHRDIKPENILVQGDHAIVSDFGIALAIQQAGGPRLTQTGLSLGTPQYMSPEQAMGERTIGPAADIWALGAVTYELLTGEAPFTGATVQAIVSKVLASDPEPITRTRRTVPAHVEAAVLKALAKLPADRWPNAGEFARALRSPESAAPAVPRQGPTGTRTESGRRANVAALAVGAIGIAAAAWTSTRPGAVRDAEPRFYDLALPDTSPLAFSGPAPLQIWQRALALSPDGRALAYVVQKRGRPTRLAVRHLDSGEWRELAGTDSAFHPFFSPNGQWIAFFVGAELRRIPTAGGATSVIARDLFPVGATWFSPESILVADGEGRVPVWHSPSGRAPDTLRVACGSTPSRDCSVMDPHIVGDRALVLGTAWDQLSFISLRDGSHSVGGLPVPPVGVSEGVVRPLQGAAFHLLASGHLLFADGTDLRAARIDLRSRRVTDASIPVLAGVRREVTYPFSQFDVSASGTLAFAPGVDANVSVPVWLAPDGTRDTLPLPQRTYRQLHLSHSRTYAGMARSEGFEEPEPIIVDVRSGREIRTLTAGEVTGGTWMPRDSLRLSLRTPEGEARFAVLGSPTMDRPVLVQDGLPRTTLFSPDGRWSVSRWADSTVLRSRVDSTVAPMPLPHGSWDLSFSPDSRWLAYSADRRILVLPVPFDGRRYEVAAEGATQPRWFPDGRRLAVYRGREILAIDLTFREGGVQLGRPRQLLEGPFPRLLGWVYDIGADGRILTFLHADEQGTNVIRIITNFPEYVRRREREAATR